MTFAVESGAFKASPAARRSAPPSERHELQIASEQQVAELAEAVGSDYAVLIYAAAYTGLWAGELAALRVRDLDFMRSRIHVRQAVAEVHGELIYGQPTSARRAPSRSPRFCATCSPPISPSTPRNPTRSCSGRRPAGRCVTATSTVGTSVLRPTRLAWMASGSMTCGHTCATFLIASGAHPRALMERLGHHSVAVTLDAYGHLLPALDDALTDDRPKRRESSPERGFSGVGLRGFEPPTFAPQTNLAGVRMPRGNGRKLIRGLAC